MILLQYFEPIGKALWLNWDNLRTCCEWIQESNENLQPRVRFSLPRNNKKTQVGRTRLCLGSRLLVESLQNILCMEPRVWNLEVM